MISPGDAVTTTLGGRRVRGHVLYVRGDSVRVELPGGAVTRPMSKVKPVRARTPAPISKLGLCKVPGCYKQRGYYLNECYEHAGPDPYEDDDSAPEPSPMKIPLRPVPKPPKPLRDAAYMKWVRDEHACCIRGCGMPATEAHHHGPRGMGQKTDDYRVLPMCARCHREFHDTGTVNGMPRDEFDAFAARWQAGLLFDYLRISESEGCALDGLIEAIRRSNDG